MTNINQLSARLSQQTARKFRSTSYSEDPQLLRSETQEIREKITMMRETLKFRQSRKCKYKVNSDPLTELLPCKTPRLNLKDKVWGQHKYVRESKNIIITDSPINQQIEPSTPRQQHSKELHNLDNALASDILYRTLMRRSVPIRAHSSTKGECKPQQPQGFDIKIKRLSSAMPAAKAVNTNVCNITVDNFIQCSYIGVPVVKLKQNTLKKVKQVPQFAVIKDFNYAKVSRIQWVNKL